MVLPVQSFVWPRLREVVGRFVLDATGLSSTGILWDEQNQPRPDLPYIGLSRRNFPLNISYPQDLIIEVPTSTTLTVTASTPGDNVGFILFGLPYRYTLQAGEDATDARNALLALVLVDILRTEGPNSTGVGFQPCTSVSSGAVDIDFAGLGVGPVYIDVIEGCTAVDTLEQRALSQGLRRAIVRFDLYFPEQQVGFEMIDEYVDVLRSELMDEGRAVWLQSRGVGVEQAASISAQNISAVSGAATQRRAFFDVIFNAASTRYKLPFTIDDVTATGVELIGPTSV